MKVSYITMQFPVPSETFLSLDVEALRKQGHELTVYGLRPNHKQHNQLMQERDHEGLVVNNFSFKTLVLSLWFCLLHPWIFLSLLFWVVRVSFKTPKHLLKSLVLLPSVLGHFYKVYQFKPNVVHLFWGHYPSMLGYLVKRFMPDTVVSQFLGAHDLVTNYPGSAALAKNVDLLFTHSQSNLPMFEKMGIDSRRVHVILRGTKLDFPYEGSLDKFNSLDAPIFLTASRLIEEKGIDDVIKIFNHVIELYPNATLNVAGDGPYKSELIKLADRLGCSKNVVFLGHIKQSSLIKLMSNSHFFVLMSRYPSERLPNVVKEAMYQMCVVLTTQTEGINELIESNVSGYIVDKGDYLSGIDSIMNCLNNTKLSQKITVEAKSVIKERFDVKKSMQMYIDLWSMSLKRKKTP
ncbi:glycosyltransferase [Vibrio cincinnatiensis]|uniref:glycosyltransferase n=1 Tax=Vibrio cincinnatiensis TaxID=675 RepID=UPI001EDF9A13|nr:glycosyltransferase [Vibrio cincinnatiensis]MCG3727438.1 glycosyltransferase [Vibrio cincinnatiensis]